MKKQTKLTIIVTALLAMVTFWLRADQCLSQRTVKTTSAYVTNGAYAEISQAFFSSTVELRVFSQTSEPRNVHTYAYVWFNGSPLALSIHNQWYTNVRSAGRTEYVLDCWTTNYAKVQLWVEIYATNGTMLASNWAKVEQPSNAE